MSSETFVIALVIFGLIGLGIKNAFNSAAKNEKVQSAFWAAVNKWIK